MMNNKTTRGSASGSKRPGRNTTSLVVIGLGVLFLMISVISFLRPSSGSGITSPKLNTPISNFELADIDDRWVSLSDYEGQVVLINTWASWCPPCRAEMPDLNAFYNQYKDQGFVVLAINGGEAPAIARDFAIEYGLSFPVLVDPDYRVLDAMRIDSYPTSIVIDRDGIVRSIRMGMHTPETLQKEVLPLIEN